jgi:hypothetical protein
VYFIIDEITQVLKDGLIDIKSLNITKQKKDPIEENKKKNSFPFISIYDNGFKFDKIGIGYSGGQHRQEIIEQEFDSDGKNIIFKLANRPLRPIISIQNPKGIAKKEKDDYFFNYSTNEIKFISPPEKGKKNVIVKYVLAKNSAEVKILRLKLNCIIDIWSNADNVECDSITLQIIKTILLHEYSLNSKNIHIQGVNCINLNIDNEKEINNYNYNDNNTRKKNNKSSKISNNEDKDDHLIFGRRLNYLVETEITTDIPISIIEDIKIKEKKI